MLYIRRKTLITLRSIDSERRSYLFVFLYENKLLSTSGKRDILPGADLRNIIIESPVTGAYEFSSSALQLVNLWNATFTWCVFKGVTNFNGSIMNDMKFNRVTFEYQFFIHGAKLTNVTFIECHFDGIEFRNATMNNATFIRSTFSRT